MRKDRAMIIGGLLACVALVGAGTVGSYLVATNLEQTTIEVVNKERLMQVSSSGDGGTSTSWKNFVYTKDETYQVADSMWNWHFRAGTVYAQIPEKGTCEVTLSGYRWGFLSMYQNIIEANCEES